MKRWISLIVSLVLLLSLVPVGAPVAAQQTLSNEEIQEILDSRRQEVLDAMYGMATVMWRATEDICYSIGTDDVTIKAGRLYRGIPYAYGRGTLAAFMEYAGEPDANGVVEISGLDGAALQAYPQHARIGNDCAGAATVAYGSIGASVKNAGASGQAPINGFIRVGLNDYTVKPSDETNSGSEAVCQENGEQVMYGIYSQAQKADLWVCPSHTIMNVEVNVVLDPETGNIDGDQSTVTIVHQTPGYIRDYVTYTSGEYSEANYGEPVYKTFGVDEVKSFKWLYDNGYMPVTCADFLDVNVKPDADISVTDSVKEEDYGFDTLLQGTLTANRFIETVEVTITDANGETVQQARARNLRVTAAGTNSDLSYDLSQLTRENPNKMIGWVDPSQLNEGAYHCTVTCRVMTGEVLTARDFDFTVGPRPDTWVDNSNIEAKFAEGTTTADCPVCKEPVTWEPLPEAVDAHVTLAEGHYYLAGDLTANTKRYVIESAEVCIHLNGHDITTEDVPFRVNANGNLKIMGNGEVAGAYNGDGSYLATGAVLLAATAELHLYGGTYTHLYPSYRATITVAAGAKAYMYDGAIICKKGERGGPQVYLMNGTFTMNGGKILDGDNRTAEGGNVIVGDGKGTYAKFIQNGGVISDGKGKSGGNIYVVGAKSSFIQNDGIVYMGIAGYNKKEGSGGNIYMTGGGTLQLDGTVIYGKSYTNGGNVYVDGGTVSVGGLVTKGNGNYGSQADDKFGGNIYMGGEAQLTVTGTVSDPMGTITYGENTYSDLGNVTVTSGTVTGGVYNNSGNVILSGNASVVDTTGKISSITLNTGKLEIAEGWSGEAGVKWDTEYTCGDAVDSTDLVYSTYSGKLYYEGMSSKPELMNADGSLIVPAVQIVGKDSSRWVASNEEAVAQVANGEYLKLYSANPLTLGVRDVYVDFNGQTNVPVTAKTGKLLGMDSTAGAETAGTASANVTGTVSADVTAPDGNRYIAITEDGSTTFHRLDMRISGVSIRPSANGVYYTTQWKCDPVLNSRLKTFGMAISAANQPKANFRTDSDTLWNAISKDQFESGVSMNSVIIENILKAGEDNDDRGSKPIYCVPYVVVDAGNDAALTLMGKMCNYSMYSVMSELNEMYPTLGQSNQKKINSFYEKCVNELGVTWTFNNIK